MLAVAGGGYYLLWWKPFELDVITYFDCGWLSPLGCLHDALVTASTCRPSNTGGLKTYARSSTADTWVWQPHPTVPFGSAVHMLISYQYLLIDHCWSYNEPSISLLGEPSFGNKTVRLFSYGNSSILCEDDEQLLVILLIPDSPVCHLQTECYDTPEGLVTGFWSLSSLNGIISILPNIPTANIPTRHPIKKVL